MKIRNFRNFENFDVDLNKSTVIVGENMAGKSNFLHALRLVLDPDLPDAQRYLRDEDFWDGLHAPFAGEVIEVKVFIRGFEGDKSCKAVLADCIVERAPLTAVVTYQYRPTGSSAPEEAGENEYEFTVFGGDKDTKRVGTEVRRWLRMVLLPALRDAAGDIRAWRRSPLRPLLNRARKEIDTDELDTVLEKLDEAGQLLLKKNPIKKLQESINERMKGLVGPIHQVDTSLAFASTEPDDLFRSLSLYLREGQTRPLNDASLGAANVIFLALLLQDLDARRSDGSIAGSILAVEEPEAHLHPHLQRLLFRHFLRRAQNVLVTTHSPHLASVAPLDSLVLLRMKNGAAHASSAAKLVLSEGERADLERYLDVTRAEMVFAKGVMFVEGSAEQFLVPAFAEHRLRANKIADSLDEIGVSVCSVSGADFDPYCAITSEEGWCIPSVVITDGDERPSSDGRNRWLGLARGAKLLESELYDQMIENLDDDDDETVRETLSEAGVFVGARTLEIDLLENLQSEIIETYKDFKAGARAQQNFETHVETAGGGDVDAENEVLSRIDAVGKGRFAQRLAHKITDQHEPPGYIADAIDHIVELVLGETGDATNGN